METSLSQAQSNDAPWAPVEGRAAEQFSERDLWNSWRKDGDEDARGQLLSLHLPYARVVAASYYAKRLHDEIEFGDYLQLASLGLIEAVGRFDPEYGVQFRTFAARRMHGSILDGIEHLTEKQQQIAAKQRLDAQRCDQGVRRSGARRGCFPQRRTGTAIRRGGGFGIRAGLDSRRNRNARVGRKVRDAAVLPQCGARSTEKAHCRTGAWIARAGTQGDPRPLLSGKTLRGNRGRLAAYTGPHLTSPSKGTGSPAGDAARTAGLRYLLVASLAVTAGSLIRSLLTSTESAPPGVQPKRDPGRTSFVLERGPPLWRTPGR